MKSYMVSSKYINRVKQATREVNTSPPESCEHCGDKDVKLVRHHPNYLEPHFIIWVCKTCHSIIHAKELRNKHRKYQRGEE